MNVNTWTHGWWGIVVVAYAIVQVPMGVVILTNMHYSWSILIGFGPAALLLGGLMLRNRQRGLATVMIVLGSLMPGIFWWMMYPYALAAIVIGGGWWSGKIGRMQAAESPTA